MANINEQLLTAFDDKHRVTHRKQQKSEKATH